MSVGVAVIINYIDVKGVKLAEGEEEDNATDWVQWNGRENRR